MRLPMILPCIALASLLPACAADRAGEWSGSVTDSAGIAIVRSPAAGMWTEQTAWTVEEQLRIGAAEGDPDYQFGQIAGVGVGADGRIFVLDQQAQQVRVYSPDGVYERTIGRPGTGPGELGMGAAALLVLPGDTILVPDMQNQRVNLFLPDGSVLASFRMSVESGIPLRWDVSPNGIVGQLRPLALPDRPAVDSMDAIVTIGTDGSVRDTLRTIPSGRTFSFAGGAPEINVFAAEPVWALADDGRLFFAVNSDYTISAFGPDGALQRVVTKPFERQPIEQADRDAMVDAFERLWREAGVPPPVAAQLRSRISFADHFPAFLQLLGGPDGTIWVQRIQRPSALPAGERDAYNPQLDLGGREWDVFDAEGRYLGQLDMPLRFQPFRFIGDDVYGVWRDEIDVQYVLRLRIRMGAE